VRNLSEEAIVVTLSMPWSDSTYRTPPCRADSATIVALALAPKPPKVRPPIDSMAFRIDSAGTSTTGTLSFSLAPNTALLVGRVMIAGVWRVHAPVAIEIDTTGRRERLTAPDIPCRFRYVRASLVYDVQR
jgi:hypothetical protein